MRVHADSYPHSLRILSLLVTLAYDFEGEEISDLSYRIYNQSGKLVMDKALEGETNEILLDLTGLSTGVYNILIIGDGKILTNKKIDLID